MRLLDREVKLQVKPAAYTRCLMAALISRLTFIAFLSVTLIARLTFVPNQVTPGYFVQTFFYLVWKRKLLKTREAMTSESGRKGQINHRGKTNSLLLDSGDI